MIPRMTSTGSLKGYRYNLQRNTFSMNKAMNTVITGRAFNSFAEDPALAAHSFHLRRSYLRTTSQHTLNETTVRKFDVAYSAMDSVEKVIDTDPDSEGSAYYAILRAISDPTASGRNALGQEIVAHANDMVQFVNGRYGDNFVFAGADALNVPLTWEAKTNPDYNPESIEAFQYLKNDGSGEGTNDPAEALRLNPNYDETVKDETDPRSFQYLDAEGKATKNAEDAAVLTNSAYSENVALRYVTSDGKLTNDASEAGRSLCYRGIPVDSGNASDLEKLDSISKGESKYIDVGLGYDMNGGKVESSTVYDSSLHAVDFLGGYGLETRSYTLGSGKKDGDGAQDAANDGKTYTFDDIPKNIVALTDEIGSILSRCKSEDGSFVSDEEKARFYALVDAFEESSYRVKDRYTELTTQSQFLKNNTELLETNAYTINEQIQNVDYVDPAAAISDFMFARYCYDTSLKVGNSILSQTLMDYMNF